MEYAATAIAEEDGSSKKRIEKNPIVVCSHKFKSPFA